MKSREQAGCASPAWDGASRAGAEQVEIGHRSNTGVVWVFFHSGICLCFTSNVSPWEMVLLTDLGTAASRAARCKPGNIGY